MVNSMLTVVLTMFLLGSHESSSSPSLFSGSLLSANLFSSSLGFVGAKKMRKKKRRFNAEQALLEITEAWAQTMTPGQPIGDNLNCDQAIDEHLLRLPDIGSLFYPLVNGWYLGEWADYSSCLADAQDSQYVMASVTGNYNGTVDFTRGGIGKYTKGFSTRMGFCFPSQCSVSEVDFFTRELVTTYATGVGWQDISIEYVSASKNNDDESKMTAGAIILLILLGLGLVIAGAATCIELCTVGDQEDLKEPEKAELLHEASKFRRLTQYDCILLQRKTPFFQKFLPLSILRCLIQCNVQPRMYRSAVQREMAETTVAPQDRITTHLRMFNGLKAASVLLAIWGLTFQLSWFSVLSNPDDIEDMQNSFLFIIVSGTVFTVPVFFFCSGFLQTLSFLQRDEETRFNFGSILGFYCRKILRFVPLNVIALLVVIFGLPLMAEGPIWGNFKQLIAPCTGEHRWVQNVFWINNLTPRDIDDKCLPWTWFVPCYIQLTLLLPPLLFVGIKGGQLGNAIIASLVLAFIVINFIIVFAENVGASIVRNDIFYSRVFMMPYYHATTFIMGILSSLVYHDYLRERGNTNQGNSIGTRFFSLISQNAVPRYVMYLMGILMIIGSILWQMPFYSTKSQPSRVSEAAFASVAMPMFILGLNMLIMPALVGRAQLFRFIFSSQSWTMLNSMSIGLMYAMPIIGIYYFMATQHQIQVTYYMFLYYFTGNLVFGVALYIVMLPYDKPIQGYLNLDRDVKDAEMSRFYSLHEYMENFKDNRLVTIYENNAPRQYQSYQGSEGNYSQQIHSAGASAAHILSQGQEIQEQDPNDLRKTKDIYRDSNDSRNQTQATVGGAPRDQSSRLATNVAGNALFNRDTNQ